MAPPNASSNREDAAHDTDPELTASTRGEGPPLDDGYIEPPKPREELRQEPYPLPKDFEWTTVDITDPVQNKEVHDLLSMHYVEDADATMRIYI
ncbi:hypothetical protein C8F01DRAFT_1263870 [Mycena amicta]|nr:hypothetical protein C8F01DRAFT_1263870 [Mycena amicta]